jgi:protein involved in polysaccharide export with SLBB domain
MKPVVLRHAALALAISSALAPQAQAQFSPPAAGSTNAAALQASGLGNESAQSSLQGTGAFSASGLGNQNSRSGGLPRLPGLNGQDQDSRLPELSPELRRPSEPPKPSQFQRFVQESTGKLLPVYGADLFSQPHTYAPVSNIAPPAHYVLGPGDEVQLQVWGAIDLASKLVVDSKGQITLPKVGAVTVAGISVGKLEPTLKAHLGKVFTNIDLSASVAKLRSIQVYVVGQAQRPGTYTLSSLSTLVNALFASGGPNANGSMRAIQLKRSGQLIVELDLYDFIAKGDKLGDPSLQPGDVIVIPPAGARVAVTGAYDQAAIYEVKSGRNSVGDLLALGGGVPTLATPQKALLERIDPSNPASPRQVQEIALAKDGLQQPLRDGDVLTLLPISPAFGNAVTLQGSVAQPLRHAWTSGMKVADLIPEREALINRDYFRKKNALVQTLTESELSQGESRRPGQNFDRTNALFNTNTTGKNPQAAALVPGMNQANSAQFAGPGQSNDAQALQQRPNQNSTDRSSDQPSRLIEQFTQQREQINWDYAVIERLNKDTLTTQLIPFNLGKAVLQRDPEHNLPLQPGDVVSIFSQADLRLPSERQSRLVRIEGEVAAPGVYQAKPGETLRQVIQRVGGLTPQAYVFGTEFTRESVRKQQQKNLDQLVAKLEASMSSQSSAQFANLGAERAAQTAALLEAQKQNQQQQLARLKTLRSNGRVALEMAPSQNSLGALPDVPLEDGDRIIVPSTPGFVAAFGAVNNENVFVYKPGRTVDDVLRIAGVSEDGELDQTFVLRADGTVVARKDRSGWFSGSFDSLALMPGDTVVVPQKVDRETKWSFITRVVKDWTQILANLGLGVAAINSL